MKTIGVLLMIGLMVRPANAQEFKPLMDAKTRDLFHEVLSGELAKEHVIQITRHHRVQGSRDYRNAAQYVLQQLRSYGFAEKDAYIESFKSDGKAVYQTWQSPSGWDITSAELRMVEPFDERIVGYPEIAMSVMTYSNPGDATSELVWVGTGTSDEDYKGKDVKGKFVLATGYGGAVHRLAVLKYGAKAVICYLDDERAKDYPDMLQYTGMWPRTEELSRVTFGFNLTNRQGTRLRDLLLSGKRVVLHGVVKGIGLEPYFMDVVVARLRGTQQPEEELVFSAHLDHPKESANDNASGSAAILDIARTFKELIDSGRMPRPKKSLRFMWVPEWYGTMAYLDAHPEMAGPSRDGQFLAAINMDMVGENVELLHSKLVLTQTPASVPSVLNDVVENLAMMVDRLDIRTPRGSRSVMNFRMEPYGGGSDHMMFIDLKISAMMFGHGPDYTHHTSEDTPDKVDPVELERSELIGAGSFSFLANLSSEQALDLLSLAYANSSKRLGDAGRRAMGLANEFGNAERKNVIEHQLECEKLVLQSVLQFNDDVKVKDEVQEYSSALVQQAERLMEMLPYASGKTNNDKSDKRIPIRLKRGPLDFGLPESKLDSTSLEWYRSSEFNLSGDERFELVNFIDGKHTVTQIRNALSAEFRPTDIKQVAHYIEDLVKSGVVTWK